MSEQRSTLQTGFPVSRKGKIETNSKDKEHDEKEATEPVVSTANGRG